MNERPTRLEVEMRMRDNISFDWLVLVAASSALILSVGFMNDVLPVDVAAWAFSLYLSWAFFAVSWCTSLISLMVRTVHRRPEETGAAPPVHEDIHESPDRRRKIRYRHLLLNVLPATTLLFGMSFLAAFVFTNVDLYGHPEDPRSHADAAGAPSKQGTGPSLSPEIYTCHFAAMSRSETGTTRV
jgi:hypothetical protein